MNTQLVTVNSEALRIASRARAEFTLIEQGADMHRLWFLRANAARIVWEEPRQFVTRRHG